MKQVPSFRFSMRWVRWAVLLVSVVAAAALAQTARATTLAGEGFVARVHPDFNGTDVITVTCGPGVITYHAEGLAAGPHSGRFVEDGTVVFDPPTGGIVSFDATFAITSPVGGDVTGEKHLVDPPAGDLTPVAVCDDFGDIFVSTLSFTTGLCYRAQFADGSSETGQSGLELSSIRGGVVATLEERFTLDPTVSCGAACPDDSDEDRDGLTDHNESLFSTLLGNPDSDLDGIKDGNDDANGNGKDDEDEDDDEDDGCPDEDSDDDGVDDEDEDDDEDDKKSSRKN